LIELRDFTFTYNGAVKPALQDVNLAIEGGEFVLITGPSGGGKSTLCRCFNGLVPHFYGGTVGGKAEVQGMDILRTPPKELAMKVGMVFQDPENQLVTSDVEREIAFGLENLGFPVNLIARRVEEALDTVNIAGLRFRRHHELSGGEKQKVAIASVLALHPDVLVLDEPTSELDPQSAEEVLRLLERLNDELGITVVLVEHRLDRVVHLVDRLMQRLREKGLEFDELPLTVKEARLKLQKALGKVNTTRPADEHAAKDPVMNIDRMWFSYGDRTALRDISMTVNRGEFIAVMGRNASGKTTLVKHFNGLLRPGKGRITLDGVDTSRYSVDELSRWIGYVFQNPNDHLFADTVEEEVAFSLKNRGVAPEEIEKSVERMLQRFKLTEYRKSYPRSLSGGEKQRLALASVLVTGPRIIVLDEPTRGMDFALKQELTGFLTDYCRDGNAVVMVTHDVETVAECADRVVLLSEGRVVVDGSRREALSKALLFSPQVNRLAQALSSYGVADTTLTVDEMLGQIT